MTAPDALTERLHLVNEEAGELIHATGKTGRHGLDSNWGKGRRNRVSMAREAGQLIAILDMLVQCGDLDPEIIEAARAEKLVKVHQFLHHDENQLAAKAARLQGSQFARVGG